MKELFKKCMEEAQRRTEYWGNRFWAARGALNKGTPPPPPPPPTPTQIAAGNAETAEHVTRLQRAMQFGEPMLRKGFKEEGGKYYDVAGGEVLPSEAIEVDFTNYGDTDLARKEWEFQKEMSPLQAEFMLEQAREFGPQFTEESRKLVEASDPTGYAAREMAGQKAMDYEPETLPEGPMLEGITEDVVIEDSPETTANAIKMQEYLRSQMDGGYAQRAGDRAQRIARGRASASGNIYGGGAIAQEARGITDAEDAAMRQAGADYIAFMQSGQSADDRSARLAQMNQQNKLTGISSRNTAAQQTYQNAMNRASGQEQLKQQQMANLQSFSGLAPVSSQFGMLGGAQQAAAANFMPTQYEATSGQSLYGMNQGLAQSNYQGAMDAWQTQAQIGSKPSPFGQILGTVAGAALGGPMGASLGSSLFGGGGGGGAAPSGAPFSSFASGAGQSHAPSYLRGGML